MNKPKQPELTISDVDYLKKHLEKEIVDAIISGDMDDKGFIVAKYLMIRENKKTLAKKLASFLY